MPDVTYNNMTNAGKTAGLTQPTKIDESTIGAKSGTGSNTQSGTQTTTQQGSQSTINGVNISNMTAANQDVLNSLIAALSDKPTVSRAQAEMEAQQKGMGKPSFSIDQYTRADINGNPVNNGVSYRDYRGMPITKEVYDLQMKQYENTVAKIQQEGGITAGGTKETMQASKDIQNEIATVRSARDGYSKQNAIKDSSAFIDKASRELMDKTMPILTGAIEASGTSGGAVAGLIQNDAVARAAENAAALGVNAAVEYGKISNDQSQVLANLIEKSPVALNALMSALGIAKGAVQQGVTSSNVDTNNKTTVDTSQTTKSATKEDTNADGTKITTVGKPQNDGTTLFGSYKF